MEFIKVIIEKIIDLEKQYVLLIFFTLIWILKIFSGGALEGVLNNVENVFNEHLPGVTSVLYTLFDGNFIYNFTKILAMLSALSLIIGYAILIIQLIYDKYSKLGMTQAGFKYTFDLFGGISITSVNIYIFIWLLMKILHGNKIRLYITYDSIIAMGFIHAVALSVLILLGLFVNGKPKKEKNNHE